MRIIASSISLLSTAFFFGQAALSNAENAEETLIRDSLQQDAPIHHHGPVNAVTSSPYIDDENNSIERSSFQQVIDTLHRDYEAAIESRGLMTMYMDEAEIRKKKDNNRAPKGEYTPIRIIKNDAPLRARKSDEALNDEDNNYHYNTAINNLVEMVIPRVVSTFQSMLYVEAPTDPVDLRNRQENCGNVNLPEDPMLNGDFYIIFDGVRDSDEEICRKNKNLAGISQACSFDLWPFNPRAGIISICLDRINVVDGVDGVPVVEKKEIDRLVSLQLGELATALGVSSDLFGFYNDETGLPVGYMTNRDIDCLDGQLAAGIGAGIPANVQSNTYDNGKTFYEITTPMVTQVVRNIFDCQSMTGARLENQAFKPSAIVGSTGACIGSGWDARLFHEEVLSNHVDASEASKILSPLTLALLEDSGWYKVDFSAAEAVSFGLGAGCSFVEDNCIDSTTDNVALSSRGIFCNDDVYQCDPSYHSRAYCNWDYLPLPTDYQNFEDRKRGGIIAQYDYCPIAVDWLRPCEEGKRCFREGDEAACLDALCEKGTVKFSYNDVTYTCESDFEELDVGSGKIIECPRIKAFCPELGCAAACSGRGVCNWGGKGASCSCAGKFKNDGCFMDLAGPIDPHSPSKKHKEKEGSRRGRRRTIRGGGPREGLMRPKHNIG